MHQDNRTPIKREVTFRNPSRQHTYSIALLRFQGGTDLGAGTTGGFVSTWEIEGWWSVGPGQSITLWTGDSDHFYWYAKAPHAVYSTTGNQYLVHPTLAFKRSTTSSQSAAGMQSVGFLEAKAQRGGLQINLAP